MIITGLIVEYNPFHNGHAYHINKSRSLTNPNLVIAVMSGNFVQRGEPAIINKWDRTKMALNHGVDLVIELPTIYATSSAENFAYGAILALNSINADFLVFGSESNDIEKMKEIASISLDEPPKVSKELQCQLNKGLSFMQANQIAYEKILPHLSSIIAKPNNILGVNYLKALKKLNSKIKPLTIKRKSSNYHDLEISNISSATAIRNNLTDLSTIKCALPDISYQILEESIKYNDTLKLNDLSNIIITLLRRSSLEDLYELPDMEQGMAELIMNSAYNNIDLEGLVEDCTSKRYSSSRIRRVIIRFLLKITNNDLMKSQATTKIPYLRVLGLNSSKSKLIKEWKNEVECSIIQKTSNFLPEDSLSRLIWDIDLRATDIYCANLNSENYRVTKKDFSHPLIVI